MLEYVVFNDSYKQHNSSFPFYNGHILLFYYLFTLKLYLYVGTKKKTLGVKRIITILPLNCSYTINIRMRYSILGKYLC